MERQPARAPWEWVVPLVKILAVVVLVVGLALAAWLGTEVDDAIAVLPGVLYTVLGFAVLAILALIAETLLESRDLARAQLAELREVRERAVSPPEPPARRPARKRPT